MRIVLERVLHHVGNVARVRQEYSVQRASEKADITELLVRGAQRAEWARRKRKEDAEREITLRPRRFR